MDTNKIREAQALIDEARHRGHNIPQLVEAARLLKAELDAAPKVMTNEEAGRITDYVYRNGLDGVPKNEIAMAKAGFNFGLRYARDNGYLAPAAGLTVEGMIEVVDKWMREPNEDGDYFKRDNLRARLTAAIEAKQNRKA